jgi:uncharacterized membrane protein
LLKKIFKIPFFWIIAIDGAFGLAVFYYWLLRQNTSLTLFLNTMKGEPWYLYPDLILTFLAIVLFGLLLAITVYSFQRKSFSWKGQGSSVGGFIFGAFGTACPFCGAFLFSAIGLSGGLALFPLAGLELKILSVILFAVALYFALKKMLKSENCVDCSADVNDKYDYKIPIAVFFVILMALGSMISPGSKITALNKTNITLNTENIEQGYEDLSRDIFSQVLPEEGFVIPIKWGDVIPKITELGVIDLNKFIALYGSRGGLSDEQMDILTKKVNDYIVINEGNSNFLVNVFWGLGLANKNSILDKSPMITGGYSVFNFASTGGWTLGKDEKGGNYYNKYEIIKLTPEQQKVAQYVADGSYRPCCNNSTSFPDCNHGAALLGLIELGASQGLAKEELFDVAVKFNSFWFPQNYLETALYFKITENTDWKDVDKEKVMSFDFSSASGWQKNVHNILGSMGVLPKAQSGGGCGI